MGKIKAILTLIRFPNLIFIFLTQWLSYECIILHRFPFHLSHIGIIPVLTVGQSLILCFSTALIAAAGYMINDYFDMGIDTINKPQKVTVERVFSRRRIISWHVILNALALVMAACIYAEVLLLRFLLLPLFSILLLIVYSTTLKRKLFVGNFSIALLTALTVFNAALFEPNFHATDLQEKKVLVFWLYIVFAFFITFIREVIKDIEDMKGDSAIDCKTIPLVFGINTAKHIVSGISVLLILFMIISLFLKTEWSLFLSFLWILGIILPLIYAIFLLYRYNTQTQFHRLSSLIKWITFMGILSMIFI